MSNYYKFPEEASTPEVQRTDAFKDIAQFSDSTWTEVNANGIWTPVEVQTSMEQCVTENLINI